MASRGERARAAAAALTVNLFLGVAFVTGLALREERTDPDSLETFDVSLPPPPPPPPEIKQPQREDSRPEPEGAEGRGASPVVSAPSPIERAPLLVAAPVPADGRAATSGNAARGTGPGSGGAGSGSGGGGSSTDIGSEARLLGGNRSRLPSRLLRTIPQERGFAHLLLTIGPDGRVSGCETLTSSGFSTIDQALCAVMVANSRWQPARDRAGQPITVKVRYTGTWSKD